MNGLSEWLQSIGRTSGASAFKCSRVHLILAREHPSQTDLGVCNLAVPEHIV